MISGRVGDYKELSQFRDLSDFNNNYEQWMLDVKESFTRAELVALRRLVRFSASIPGICFAKIGTVVAATHQHDGIGISRSTFKRMVNTAIEVGLLVVHSTFKRGKQSHNVYVFNRYNSTVERNVEVSAPSEPPKEEQLNQPNKTSNLLKLSTLKDKDIRTVDTERKISSSNILPSFVNKQFATKAGIYFHNNEITELYRIGYIHAKMTELHSETLLDVLDEGLALLVSKLKRQRNKIKNIMGFWNGICKKLCKKYWIIDTFDEVGLGSDQT
jgi:hypothetical protein